MLGGRLTFPGICYLTVSLIDSVKTCWNLLSTSLPPLCIWSGCFPLLWAPGRWRLWGSQLSLNWPSSRPCSPRSSCSGRWWSGKLLWTAGGWRSSGLWRSLQTDLCCHKWTRNTNTAGLGRAHTRLMKRSTSTVLTQSVVVSPLLSLSMLSISWSAMIRI